MFIKNRHLAALVLGVAPLILAVGCLGKFGKGMVEKEAAAQTIDVWVPQGTQFTVSLSEGVSTNSHSAGSPWTGQLVEDVWCNGMTVWAAGTPVSGVVSHSAATGRLSKAGGGLGLRLTDVGDVPVNGSTYSAGGEDKAARNAKVIGTSAGLGALGGILSSPHHRADHALGGALIGAAVGTGLAAATANTTVAIGAGRRIKFRLLSDVSILMDAPNPDYRPAGNAPAQRPGSYR